MATDHNLIYSIYYSSMPRMLDTHSIKKTLKTDFSNISNEKKIEGDRKFYYDSFAFRDRITNNKFQYKQARKT